MSNQQATIERNTTNEKSDVQPAKKKKTSFDLAKEKDRLERELDELLSESHGEVDEEVDELLGEISALEGSIEEKIKAYRWVKKKLEEEVEAWEARKKYHSKEASKRRDTRNARKNNLSNLKDRAAFLLSKMDGESIRIDGKKVYNRTYYKVNIQDEVRAYEALKDAGLAEKEYALQGDEVEEMLTLFKKINKALTHEGTDEPMANIDPKLITKVKHSMDFIDTLKKNEGKIKFAGGRELNAHAKELCETANEKKEKILSQIRELRQEKEQLADDLTDEEIEEYNDRLNDLHLEVDDIDRAYSIPGAEIEVSKTPFGL